MNSLSGISMPLFIQGVTATTGQIMPLFLQGPLSGTPSVSIPLWMYSLQSVAQTMPLYLGQYNQPINTGGGVAIPLFMQVAGQTLGGQSSQVSMPLFIAFQFSWVSMPLFLQNQNQPTGQSIPLFISGYNLLTQTMPLYLFNNLASGTATMPIYCVGY